MNEVNIGQRDAEQFTELLPGAVCPHSFRFRFLLKVLAEIEIIGHIKAIFIDGQIRYLRTLAQHISQHFLQEWLSRGT